MAARNRLTPHMRRAAKGGSLLPLWLVASSCTSGGLSVIDQPRDEASAAYTVEVTNRNWQDMHVFAVKGTATYRLGPVGSNTSRRFRLPAGFVGKLGGIRLAVRPLGRRDLHYSQFVDLAPGQTLGWSLEPDLDLSFHWIR